MWGTLTALFKFLEEAPNHVVQVSLQWEVVGKLLVGLSKLKQASKKRERARKGPRSF